MSSVAGADRDPFRALENNECFDPEKLKGVKYKAAAERRTFSTMEEAEETRTFSTIFELEEAEARESYQSISRDKDWTNRDRLHAVIKKIRDVTHNKLGYPQHIQRNDLRNPVDTLSENMITEIFRLFLECDRIMTENPKEVGSRQKDISELEVIKTCLYKVLEANPSYKERLYAKKLTCRVTHINSKTFVLEKRDNLRIKAMMGSAIVSMRKVFDLRPN